MSYKEYLYARASKAGIPLGGTFELSPVCNFACHMCYVRKTKAELLRMGKEEIDAEHWIALAKQCREAGMLYLLLTGGEPFLYPEFQRLYEVLHDMGFLLTINTNGTLIDEKTMEWLTERAPARVNVTLYGASRETYGRLCQNEDGYDKAVHAVELLRRAGIQTVINGSITPENQSDLERIIQFAREHGCQANIATYMFPPLRRAAEQEDSRLSALESGRLNVIKQRLYMGDEEFGKAARRMVGKLQASERAADTWGRSEQEHMTCRAGRSSCWIAWDGRMTACDMMDFPIACYPFEEGFAQSWKKIREAVLSTAVLSECRDCTLREICHPCAAIMFAETGDVNKKAPYLCEMSKVSESLWRKAAAGEKEELTDEKE